MNSVDLKQLSSNAEKIWHKKINPQVWEFVNKNSTKSVQSRIESCYRHYTKALVIKDIDPDMSAIRIIAAEEELVVAVFDIIKRNEDKFTDCKHITKKFKNHYVKQLFPPSVSNIYIIISSFLKDGLSLDSNYDYIDINAHVSPIFTNDKIFLRLHIGEKYFDLSPFQFKLSVIDDDKDPIDEIYRDFQELIKANGYNSVMAFSKQKVEFRNKILYADDAMIFNVGEDIDDILSSVTNSINQMLWVVALLLSNDDDYTKKWGISNQLLKLYEKVLIEAKVI